MNQTRWLDSMSVWTPTEEWKGQESFIIGGGASLRGFDWSKIKGRNVIGCNEAFRLGSEIVQMVIFGDQSWWNQRKWELDKFPGRVVSCAPSLLNVDLPKLKQMQRTKSGLASGNTLAWNFSTGAAAVNLAVSLGSNQIYLLGFDMGAKEDKSHWHDHYRTKTDASCYARFIRGFNELARDLRAKRPDVRVFNVTDGTSKLPVFDRITFAELDSILLGRRAA